MSFENLPETWSDHPLSDPAVTADVVDLLVSLGDRQRGTLTLVICDHEDRYRAAVAIDLPSEFKLIPTLRPGELCSTALDAVIPAVRTDPGSSLLLALGRPGPDFWPELDTEWAEAATDICHSGGVRLIGFYVASAHHVYQPQLTTHAAQPA